MTQETFSMNELKKQQNLRDVLTNLLIMKKSNLGSDKIFDIIMSDCGLSPPPNASRKGYLYESLCILLVIFKCFKGICYSSIMIGLVPDLKCVKNIKLLLDKNIRSGGNVSDLSIMDEENKITIMSIKYVKSLPKKGSDISDIDNTLKHHNYDDYKIGLIVRNKKTVKKSKKEDIHAIIFKKIEEDNLLFDETDVKRAIDVFCQQVHQDITDDLINSNYLLSPRKRLVQRLHQKLTLIKFKESFHNTNNTKWCIAHKMRSGKSITMLLICKYLLENGIKKILIMTSYPATINSFVEDLEKWIEFKDIPYKQQNEFETIDETFSGIVFCSVQYLKMEKKGKHVKRDKLKEINFGAVFGDESHSGGSTQKTKNKILDEKDILQDVRKDIKLTIFSSGTPEKTKKFYKIHRSCVYEWDVEDESFMKMITNAEYDKTEKDSSIHYMETRHGQEFIKCLNDETLDKDYSKCPTQVLMKHSVPKTLIEDIITYNNKNGTSYGYNCSSLFALEKQKKAQPEKDKKGNIIKTKTGSPYFEYEYTEKFEICQTADGEEILVQFLDCIISSNRMNQNSIMKHVEKVQTHHNSRKSTSKFPLLFIVYLPTHTGNNNIDKLQKTLKRFLAEHDLWVDYNIEYSNSTSDSLINPAESYNQFIQTIMENTEKKKKRGCILLLGDQGTTGITYERCDVTISLDDGHSLDLKKQKDARAGTDALGKKCYANVDMNIQRTYLYLIDIIHRYRKNTKTTKSNAEIMLHLFEQNIFLFDPHVINNGKMRTIDMLSYFQKEAENMMKEIDDTPILEYIVCDDELRDIINSDFQKKIILEKHQHLEGEQQDCPKGGESKVLIDSPDVKGDDEQPGGDEVNSSTVDDVDIANLINKTFEMCKSFLFPLLALLSRSFKVHNFKDIFVNEKTKDLIFSLLINKKIDLTKNNYRYVVDIMNQIIDNNSEIVNNIREIYSQSPPCKLRQLIEKHFIPTPEEKKENAEVPTPVKLVDEMLSIIPPDFWKTPHKVFEPCCGKGNFVLGIFDNFEKGLREMYPDEAERCRIIMTECIYYSDITTLNVFITTEILKCHVQSYCGLDDLDYAFNKYEGDTLLLNIKEKWDIDGFDAVIGNPPYNIAKESKLKGGYGGRSLWDKFVDVSIDVWLIPNGYLLYVHPPSWRKPEHRLWKKMTKQSKIIYLKCHSKKEGNEIFKCSTLFDYYLLQKTNDDSIISKIYGQDKKLYHLNLSEWEFLPSGCIDIISRILGNNEVIYSSSIYDTRRKWILPMKKKESKEEYYKRCKEQKYEYPIIHNMTKEYGLGFVYSNENKGHFGVKKVVLSFGEFQYPYNDYDGKYGMSQICYGLEIQSKEEGDNICKAINSDDFKDILKYTKWSTFQTDWRMFKYFKKDFWKEFI